MTYDVFDIQREHPPYYKLRAGVITCFGSSALLYVCRQLINKVDSRQAEDEEEWTLALIDLILVGDRQTDHKEISRKQDTAGHEGLERNNWGRQIWEFTFYEVISKASLNKGRKNC